MKPGRIITIILASLLAFGFVASDAMAARKAAKQEVLYPDATRPEPKLDPPGRRDVSKLNDGLEAASEGDAEKAQQLLIPFLDGSAKSRYGQALAMQAMANLKYTDGDTQGAIEMLEQAIATNALPNDTHFESLYQLAQLYVSEGEYEKASTALTTWRNEGRRETAASYALEGNIDYRLEKYPEAIAAIKKAKQIDPSASKESWDQILAASYAESGQTDEAVALAKEQLARNPDDTTTLRNAVSMLVSAQNYPEAMQLMEEAQQRGALKDSRDWINMAKVYLVIGQSDENPKPYSDKAIAALDAGLAQGALQPGYEVYRLQGDAANIAAEDDRALAFYKKAAPFAEDGEAELRMGQILINQGKNAEGKAAVKSAIAKGVKQEGSAWMLLGSAETNTKNRGAAIEAMRKAAQFPETKAKAEAWLKQAGAK